MRSASRLDDCLPQHIRYACQYWVHHLKQSGGQIHDNDTVHEFLKQHFLHWLEVLSIMGKISETIGLIDTLQTLVQVIFIFILFLFFSFCEFTNVLC